MNHLYDRIQADRLKFRRSGETNNATALTYLTGEISRQRVQDLSDEAVLKVIKSTVKRLAQAQKIAFSDLGLQELQLLQGYLPVELAGVELETKIRDLEFTTLPEAMKKIKQWDCEVNMQQASQIVRKLLA